MGKTKKKKKRPVNEQRERQRERDAAYREALGLAAGAKLPKQIGSIASGGGGRDRRGRIVQATKKTAPARSRVKLIG